MVEHYSPATGQTAVCDLGGVVSCSRVLQSKWAVLFGVPVAVHGFSFFIVSVTASALAAWLRDGRARRDATLVSLGISFVGCIACLHFIVIEVILGALCPLCTIVHIAVILSFVFTLLSARSNAWRPSLKVLKEIISFRLPWLLLVGCVVGAPLLTCPVFEKRFHFSQEALERLGACLTKHGIRMFGDHTCSNCAAQKSLFGAAFKAIDYFECNAPGNPCAPFNITHYPTWHCLADGDRITGVTSAAVLAHWADCTFTLQ